MTVSRRTFLIGAGIVTGSTFAAPWGLARARASSTDSAQLVYSNDLTNTFNTLAPWTYDSAGDLRPMNELIDSSVAEVEGIADVHMLQPGQCLVPWWLGRDESGNVLTAGEQVQANQDWLAGRGTGEGNYNVISSRLDYCSRYLLAGGDVISDFLSSCASYSEKGFISFRLCDTQNSGNAFERYDVSPYSDSNPPPALGTWTGMEGLSKFYVDRLGIEDGTTDCRVGAPAGGRPAGSVPGDATDLEIQANWKLRGLDWAYDDVRARALEMCQDLIANYPVDGFELDFLRWPALFRETAPVLTTAERQTLVTAFISDVRSALDAKAGTGARLPLYLRVPAYADMYDPLGLDLATLADDNVIDLITLSTGYFTVQDSDLETARSLVGSSLPINVETTHTVSGGLNASGASKYRLTAKEQLTTLAELGYERGATGISAFNFAYYRPGPTATTESEPLFSTLADAKDPATLLASSAKHYTPAFAGINEPTARKLPHTFAVGGSTDFTLTLDEPAAGWTDDYRLRIAISQYVVGASLSGSTWECTLSNAAVSGLTLETTAGDPEPYAPIVQPDGYLRSDDLLASTDQMSAWLVPSSALAAGTNTFAVTMTAAPTGATTAQIGYLDLAMNPA